MRSQYGLSIKEVEASREKYGINKISPHKKRGFWSVLFSNFGDPIMKILLLVTAINFIFLFYSHNYLETFGIIISILVAVVVSTISEMGSESAFSKLEKITGKINVKVIRCGKISIIEDVDVVVGDVIMLGSGDKIPADGILLDGEISVDQSILNGESVECHKKVCSCSEQENGDLFSPCLVFSGTVVTGGSAIMQVNTIGDKTEYGKIAKGLVDEPPTSPLKIKLSKLAGLVSLIGYIGAFIAAITYLVSVSGNGFSFNEILAAATLVVSVIVMAVPEGLPMMITVVLSSNMRAMMKDNLLVRKLSAVETAGSLNILFSDKTGTITAGKLSVCGVLLPSGDYIDKDFNLRLGGLGRELATALIMNSETQRSGSNYIGGNITDRVLTSFGYDLINGNEITEQKVSTTPFSSATKFMMTEMQSGQVFYKGATEVLLPQCNISSYDKNRLQNKVAELNKKAMRVICVCEGDILLGFIAIRDEVRQEACASVQTLKEAQIQVVLVTGDARETAVAVATEVGILHGDGIVLTSSELNQMTDEQLSQILPKLRVVARAYPHDKSRLVKIAQSLNLVVGMTGDGVNDAPALKRAELGFAMGSGTEVAKAVGDIIIVDDNIKSITKAVSFGRTLFESIRKFLVFKLTINFIAMTICILAPLFGISSPITVIQMLWINLVMDTLAGLAFGGEKPCAEYMTHPPKRRDENLITKPMWNKIIWGSVFGIMICMWFLMSSYIQDIIGDERSFATVFFTFFMFLNICNAFNARTTRINIFSGLIKNKAFIFIMSIIIIAQFIIIYYGGEVFRTNPISVINLIVAGVLALSMIPAEMFRKVCVNKN